MINRQSSTASVCSEAGSEGDSHIACHAAPKNWRNAKKKHFCKIKTLKVKRNYKRMEWKLLTPRHRDARPLPGNSFLSPPPPRCCQWRANRLLHERLGKQSVIAGISATFCPEHPKAKLEVDMRTFFSAPKNRKKVFPAYIFTGLELSGL